MMIRTRVGAVALGLVAVVLMGHVPLVAQEPAASKPAAAPVVKKRSEPAKRVPRYFGQIGLTTEQRANIYSIQAKKLEKIEELERQVAAAKAEMLVDCEGVLNDTQKKLLETLRKAAAESSTKTASASKPADAPKSAN